MGFPTLDLPAADRERKPAFFPLEKAAEIDPTFFPHHGRFAVQCPEVIGESLFFIYIHCTLLASCTTVNYKNCYLYRLTYFPLQWFQQC